MVSAIAAATDSEPSSAIVEALYRRSGGIPFVVEELMRVVGPQAIVSELLEAELPWSLEEAVRHQLAELQHGHRRVVEALAVYGRAASFEALLIVTEADEEDLLADLRALVGAGVVFEVSDDQFWFTHALVADAIVHQLLGRERRRLHERCFEAVRTAPVLDHASLARHAQGADRHDEVPAIARRGASRYLQKGLTFSALRLGGRGAWPRRRTTPSCLPSPPRRRGASTSRPRRSRWRSRWLKVAVEVLDRIEAMRFVARLHIEHDEFDAAEPPLRDLEELAESLDDVQLRGVARAAVAQLHMISARPTAVEWADRALADARAAGDATTEARALVERAGAITLDRPRTESLVALHEALAAARRTGDAVLLTRAINNGLELVPAHSDEAAALRAEMQDVSGRVGFDKLGTGTALLWEFDAAFGAGDLPALRRVSAEGSQWWNRHRSDRKLVTAAQIEYALEEGRLADAAEAHVELRRGLSEQQAPALPAPRRGARRGQRRSSARVRSCSRSWSTVLRSTTRRRRSTT